MRISALRPGLPVRASCDQAALDQRAVLVDQRDDVGDRAQRHQVEQALLSPGMEEPKVTPSGIVTRPIRAWATLKARPTPASSLNG